MHAATIGHALGGRQLPAGAKAARNDDQGIPVRPSEKIQVRKEEGVSEVVMARPEPKTSLLLSLYDALTEALLDAERDPAVQVILVRGEGGQFSSGNDLRPSTASLSV
jgi:1,4-dihydroxy-2-naphthoyl-CoA synthase